MSHLLRRFALSFLIAVCLGACSTVDVVHDYDPEADFQALSTWDWLPGQDSAKSSPAGLEDKRIRSAVREVLIAKGFAKVDQAPSFYVIYRHGIDEEVDVHVFYDTFGYGYGPWWGGYGPIWGPRPVFTYTEEAVIVIDVVSANEQNRELIWRGIASYAWDDAQPPQERVEKVRQAVAKVLDNFPPRSK